MSYQRAKEIFLAACDLPADERDEFVARECGGDEALRSSVDDLLASDANPRIGTGVEIRAQLESLMTRSGPGSDTWVGKQIHRYRVVGKLGEGGMGLVYLAEQESPRRQVALKMLRAGLDSQEYRARMRREAETLGLLQHPCIAQVYDAGVYEADGGTQPYLVMEYVEGEALRTYVERTRLPVAGRLQLFVEICDAVHHAHQKGVIHRDLKPDNILVRERSTTTRQGSATGVGRPVVLDFGIARITDADIACTSMLTDAGQLMGTLPYMSPEQMTGQSTLLDTRSDIYSLGVILFQLLGGRLPIDTSGLSIPEAILRVQRQEPERLGAIDSAFRGDLETIAARALEKEPARRYASASELGADVERYLTNEPIVARPHSSLYQLAKFVRRNKGLTAGLAGTFLALTTGFVVSTVLFLRAEAARVEADEATTEARKATLEATAAAARAEAANEEARNKLREKEAIATFLTETVLAARTIARGPQATVLDFLDGASERLGDRFEDQPAAHAEMLHTLGSTYADLGALQKAEPLLEASLELRERIYGPEDIQTSGTRSELAVVYSERGRKDEAESHMRRALEVSEAERGPTDPTTLSIFHNLIDIVDDDAARRTEADELYQELLRRYGDGEPTHAQLTTLLNYGVMLRRSGREGEAESIYRHVIEIAEAEPDLFAFALVSAHDRLGALLRIAGRFEESEDHLRVALELSETFVGEEGESTQMAHAQLGSLYLSQERYAEAREHLQLAADGLEGLLGLEHGRTLISKQRLGDVLVQLGRHAEALELSREAVPVAREVFGSDHSYMASFLRVHGAALQGTGLSDEAYAAYEEALEIARASYPAGDRMILALEARLGALDGAREGE